MLKTMNAPASAEQRSPTEAPKNEHSWRYVNLTTASIALGSC